MSISIVNKVAATQVAQPGFHITFGPWNLTAGNFVAFAVTTNASDGVNPVSSVADTAGNTWLPARWINAIGGDGHLVFYYCYNCKGNATNTVTVTLGTNYYRITGYLWELSGVASGDPTDISAATSNYYSAGATPIVSSTFGTPQANGIILALSSVAGSDNSRTFTAPSDYTLDSGVLGNTGVGVCAGAMHKITNQRELYTSASMGFTVAGPTAGGIITLFVKDAVPGQDYTTKFGVWSRAGSIAPYGAGQPNVLYEGNPQILSGGGNVFKMWAPYPNSGTYYYESYNGINWYSDSAVVISGQVWTKIYKHAGTYYAYTNFTTWPPGPINAYTSPDGITWTLAKSATLTATGSGDETFIMQLAVVDIVAGTWYGYYAAYNGGTTAWKMKLATSTDGINWTKDASDSITDRDPSNFAFVKSGSTYYGWSQGIIVGYPIPANGQPSDIMRWSSANPNGPWTTNEISTIYRTCYSDGVGYKYGQIADPTIIEVNGDTYMYATEAHDGQSPVYNIAAFVARGKTIAQIVASPTEGMFDVPIPTQVGTQLTTSVSDSFPTSLSGNWTQLSSGAGYGAAVWASNNDITSAAAGTNADSWYNAFSWDKNQWAQITVNKCSASSTVGVSLRQDKTGNRTAYRFYWTGSTGSSGTWKIDYVANGSVTNLASGTTTVNVADTLTAVAIEDNLMFYQNGLLLSVIQDSNLVSGAAGFLVNPATATSNAYIGTFLGGNTAASTAAYSVPDDRNYATFPNTAVNVQGTQTYTVNAHPSHAAPVDSRAAGPEVDSRQAANIPENSRTPGTFGPGE